MVNGKILTSIGKMASLYVKSKANNLLVRDCRNSTVPSVGKTSVKTLVLYIGHTIRDDDGIC